ncbi:hypothetical protein Taro_052170 [Colocasia esculenta]|uniref:Lipoxygenase domain-containing protein n=1 Tax=Colocasia esculenta TaxID=4460 RepID=A0A843XIV4_COLES|nr:hypothetical protein [Colocasia esculenta]
MRQVSLSLPSSLTRPVHLSLLPCSYISAQLCFPSATNMTLGDMIGSFVGKFKGPSKVHTVKGHAVLVKKNVLDFTDFNAAIIDRVHEALGRSVVLQLVSATVGDPHKGNRGVLSKPAALKDWITTLSSLTPGDTSYEVSFEWEESKGVPGAFLIENNHGFEFYLKTLTLEDVPGKGRKAFLRTITSQIQTIAGVALIEILSRHASDEIYLGQRSDAEWTSDKAALEAFQRFGKKLVAIERKIEELNSDERLRNRNGPVKVPYTLLYPNTSDTSGTGGLTGRGIFSSDGAPHRDGKPPASLVPPSPPSPPAPQAPPSPTTYNPDYWNGFYMGWKMALQKASQLYGHKGLTDILPDIGPTAEHISSSPSSPPSPARSSSSPPSSTYGV